MRISDWSSDVCSSDLLALSDPATALNPFRTIGVPFAPPDVIRAFFLPENGGGRFADFGNALWGVNGYVKGPLFQVPAGQVAGLLGAEYQREKLGFQINITSGAEDADGVSDFRADRKSTRLNSRN